MNVTTADIMAFRKTVSNDLTAYYDYLDRKEEGDRNAILPQRAGYIQEIDQENEAALTMQIDALSKKASVCTPGLADKLEGHVNTKKLASEMGDNFLSYSFMRAVACSVGSTFRGLSEKTSNIAHLTALKDSVRNLHKIGEESAFGYVFTGTIGGASDLFVVKTARDEDAQADLKHELFAAIMVLNELRKILPHWAMYFAGVECPEAVIDHKTGTVTSYCGVTPGQVPYAICENITPSKSFGSVVMTCSVPQFYELLFQHLFATHIGAELVGYTHYDCHPGNCLVRKVQIDGIKDKFCIPYVVNQKTKETWYVRASQILTFIDFGMTSVTYQGVQIGAGQIDLEEFGVAAGPWGLHDAYKLLGFVAHDLIRKNANPKVLEEVRKIFTFFNKTETLEAAIKKQYDFRCFFSLPKMQSIEHFTVLDLISHIMRVGDIGDVVTRQPEHPVLECTSCYSFAATIEGAYVRDPKPTSFLDFYETAKHLGETSKVAYDRLISSFDYTKAATDFKKRVGEATIAMELNLKHEHLPVLTQRPTPADLANKATYKEAQEAYTQLVSAVSYYEDLRVWLAMGNAVAILYGDRDMISFINKERSILADTHDIITARINEIREFYRKISSVVSSSAWDEYNNRYPWYTVNSGIVISLKDKFTKADENDKFIEQRLPSALVRPVAAVATGAVPVRRRVAVLRNADGVPTGLAVR